MTTRQFSLRFVIFLTPILLYMSITMGLPLAVGEFRPLEWVTEAQESDEVLFARGYRDDFVPFKFLSVIRRQPELLILGSSRVMQFRAGMFERSSSELYNAGGAAANIYEARNFLYALPHEALPAVLILGIDQDWFNPQNSASVPRTQENPLGVRFEFSFNDILNYSRQLLLSIVRNPGYFDSLLVATFADSDARIRVGVKAVTEGIGFRSDGSIRYSTEVTEVLSTQTRLSDANLRLDTGGLRFEYASDYAREPLAVLHELLAYCTQNNIRVVAFLPPYAPSIYKRLAGEGNHRYLEKLTPVLRELFEQYDYPFADFADAGMLSPRGDDNFIDGFHGGERVYAALLLALYEQDSTVLSQFVDAENLELLLAQPGGHPLLLFDDDQVTAN